MNVNGRGLANGLLPGPLDNVDRILGQLWTAERIDLVEKAEQPVEPAANGRHHDGHAIHLRMWCRTNQ